MIPPPRRALRHLDPGWQTLTVGDLIPDYGGANETFQIAYIQAPRHLAYTSDRRHLHVTWAIVLSAAAKGSTRVHLRLRLSGVKRRWLVRTAGELVDLLTIAGLAAGLRERVHTGQINSRQRPA